MRVLLLLYYSIVQLAGIYGLDQYLGCFIDQMENRDVEIYVGDYEKLASIQCIHECQKRNYPYAAIQYGRECRCGRHYGKYGQALDDECNYLCASSEKCGGNNRNSVYNAIKSVYLSTTDFICLNTMAGYQGCFDNVTLDVVMGKVNSIEQCVTYCATHYGYAGIMNGNNWFLHAAELAIIIRNGCYLCYCGNHLNRSPTNSILCNITCNRKSNVNTAHCCGGLHGLSIYDVQKYRYNTYTTTSVTTATLTPPETANDTNATTTSTANSTVNAIPIELKIAASVTNTTTTETETTTATTGIANETITEPETTAATTVRENDTTTEPQATSDAQTTSQVQTTAATTAVANEILATTIAANASTTEAETTGVTTVVANEILASAGSTTVYGIPTTSVTNETTTEAGTTAATTVVANETLTSAGSTTVNGILTSSVTNEATTEAGTTAATTVVGNETLTSAGSTTVYAAPTASVPNDTTTEAGTTGATTVVGNETLTSAGSTTVYGILTSGVTNEATTEAGTTAATAVVANETLTSAGSTTVYAAPTASVPNDTTTEAGTTGAMTVVANETLAASSVTNAATVALTSPTSSTSTSTTSTTTTTTALGNLMSTVFNVDNSSTFDPNNSSDIENILQSLSNIINLGFACLSNPSAFSGCSASRQSKSGPPRDYLASPGNPAIATIRDASALFKVALGNQYRIYYTVIQISTNALVLASSVQAATATVPQQQIVLMFGYTFVGDFVQSTSVSTVTSISTTDGKLWIVGAVLGPVFFLGLIICITVICCAKSERRGNYQYSAEVMYNVPETWTREIQHYADPSVHSNHFHSSFLPRTTSPNQYIIPVFESNFSNASIQAINRMNMYEQAPIQRATRRTPTESEIATGRTRLHHLLDNIIDQGVLDQSYTGDLVYFEKK
ncbi:unnamed protein product [Rotaria socialis]